MQATRLGCLSSSGVIAGLATIIIIAVLALIQGGVLYNPGPLNAQTGKVIGGVTSHAELGGECEKCHVAPWSTSRMADRCTACHADIAVQMREVASLHGIMTHKNPDLKCAHCHPDHRGKDAPLTIATADDFPHEELGYSLNGHQRTGKKEPFTCRDCHTDGIAGFNPVVCLDCHVQMDAEFAIAHEKNWGGSCLSCHDGVDRFGSDFDHNIFIYQLTGRHLEVSCYACHIDARNIVDLQAAPQDCVDCHLSRDAHEGRFGSGCATCHSPSDWENATFDHARSNFPLTGAHQQVDCESCHINGQFGGTSSSCVNCHADPVFHFGLFTTDCTSCHTTTAWRPAIFNGQHTFPLNHGEGGTVSCATCHPVGLPAYTCYGCHEHNEANVRSKHLEEGIPNFQNCMECHPTGEEDGDGGGD